MTVLFVIVTIILFLAIDRVYLRLKGRITVPAAHAGEMETRPYPVRTPEGIFFTPSHTWLNLFPSGKVRLGVDDFVGRMVERPQVVLLKAPGDQVTRGEPLLVLKEEGHELTVSSPIDGEIETANEELVDHPEFLRKTLFSQGWAYGIRPYRLSELKNLIFGSESRAWMRSEFGRLRDFFADATSGGRIAPAMLQDGGPPIAGAMRDMDPDVWQKFEHEFLHVPTAERARR